MGEPRTPGVASSALRGEKRSPGSILSNGAQDTISLYHKETMLTCVQCGSFFFLFSKTGWCLFSSSSLTLLTIAMIQQGLSRVALQWYLPNPSALIGASHKDPEWIQFQVDFGFLNCISACSDSVSLFLPWYPPLLHPLHASFCAWVLLGSPYSSIQASWYVFFLASYMLQWSKHRTKLCWDKLPSWHKFLSWLMYYRPLPNILLVFHPWGSSLSVFGDVKTISTFVMLLSGCRNVLSALHLLCPAYLLKGFQQKQDTASLSTEHNSLCFVTEHSCPHIH